MFTFISAGAAQEFKTAAKCWQYLLQHLGGTTDKHKCHKLLLALETMQISAEFFDRALSSKDPLLAAGALRLRGGSGIGGGAPPPAPSPPPAAPANQSAAPQAKDGGGGGGGKGAGGGGGGKGAGGGSGTGMRALPSPPPASPPPAAPPGHNTGPNQHTSANFGSSSRDFPPTPAEARAAHRADADRNAAAQAKTAERQRNEADRHRTKAIAAAAADAAAASRRVAAQEAAAESKFVLGLEERAQQAAKATAYRQQISTARFHGIGRQIKRQQQADAKGGTDAVLPVTRRDSELNDNATATTAGKMRGSRADERAAKEANRLAVQAARAAVRAAARAAQTNNDAKRAERAAERARLRAIDEAACAKDAADAKDAAVRASLLNERADAAEVVSKDAAKAADCAVQHAQRVADVRDAVAKYTLQLSPRREDKGTVFTQGAYAAVLVVRGTELNTKRDANSAPEVQQLVQLQARAVGACVHALVFRFSMPSLY